MSPQEKKGRRGFLKSVVLTGGVVGMFSPSRVKPEEANIEKTKMLTCDGKLVEIDRRILENMKSVKKASLKELYDWMDKKHKT